MVVLLLAISAHEAAHAWMSSRFGDDTARLLGRVTLNPVAHTDPIGTLLIPMAMFIFSHIGSPLAASRRSKNAVCANGIDDRPYMRNHGSRASPR